MSVLGFQANNDLLDKTLTDHEIAPATAYVKSASQKIDRAAIDVLEVLLSTPNVGGKEQDSVTYDRAAIQARLDMILGRLNMKQSGASVVRAFSW